MTKNDSQNKKIYNYIYWTTMVLAIIVIFLLSTRHINVLKNIMAWDELGYWSNAAHLAGYDWSSAASEFSGYYSYGYSVIISLLLLMFKSGSLAYQAAIFLNGIFLSGSFVLLNGIGKMLFGKDKRWIVMGAALMASFYANNFCQCNYAWTECEIIFLYSCLVYLFCSIEKKYKFYKLTTIGILTVYMFFVHNRTVGIVIASLMIILFMVYLKKIPLKDFYMVIAGICILGIIGLFLKESIKNAVYVSQKDNAMVNTLAAALPWLTSKFTSIYGIMDLLKTFGNRFLYWGITTYGTIYIVCIYYIKHIIAVFRKRESVKTSYDFIALSILGVFGVMTIQLSQAGCYQALLYGRYQDIVVCPVFMLGILLIAIRREKLIEKIIILCLPITIVLLQIAKSIPIYVDYFVANCNVNMYKYWIGTEKGGYDFAHALLFSEVILAMLWILYRIGKDQIWKYMYIVLVIILCAISYRDSEKIFNDTFTDYQGMLGEIAEIHEICEDQIEVYLYRDNSISMTQPIAMWLQLEMFDHKVIVVNDVNDIPDGSYTVFPRWKQGEEYLLSIVVDGELVSEDKFAALYRMGN